MEGHTLDAFYVAYGRSPVRQKKIAGRNIECLFRVRTYWSNTFRSRAKCVAQPPSAVQSWDGSAGLHVSIASSGAPNHVGSRSTGSRPWLLSNALTG